jgi:hypothetical protein
VVKLIEQWSSAMNVAVDPNTNVISLSAFRATRTTTVDPRFAPPIIDIDSWYHQAEITKTSTKTPNERQQ